MEEVECPHCKEYVEIDPASRDHFEDEEDYICINCGEKFTVYAEPTVHYTTSDNQKIKGK